ncbi:unnamed protein product [Clonostachys rosea]|uniref:Protein-lysine N-methyltransferase EFM6 n=1 Tax=Bionectria ochroleuca TaxID=29856 RepID=A0ABY6U3L4_BIOOC|nr:unnamed protein product [Clonostachys rosea]
MPAFDSPESSPPLDPIEVSADLAPLPSLKSKGDTTVDFDGQLTTPLKLHEDVRTGCGGQTWPAGMLLGKHLLRYHREELQDARILELGSGIGLVGLGVLLGCGVHAKMLITDQLEMLALMKLNIERNEVQGQASALILNWWVFHVILLFCQTDDLLLPYQPLTDQHRGEPLPQEVVEQKPDVIIAAECVYFEPAFPLLMQTLRDLFALNADATVYFCFKKRRRADMNFVKMAKKAFRVEELFDEDRPVFQRQGLFLFSFKSKHSSSRAAIGTSRVEEGLS